MSLSHYDQLSDGYADGLGEVLPAVEYDSLVRILDSQLQGALAGVGAGVISGGVVSAASGRAVTITALAAIAETAKGLCALSAAASQVSNLAANSTLYLYARANLEDGGGENDSRETGLVVWDAEDSGGDLLGAAELAEIVTGADSIISITDRRTMIPVYQTASQAEAIAAIESALGTAYFEGTPPDDVDSRLSVLEALGGGGGNGPVYIFPATWKSGSVQTTGQVVQAIDDRVTALEGVGSGGNVVSVPAPPWELDSINQAEALLGDSDVVALAAGQINTVCVKFGVTGDGTGSTPQYLDLAHSTWLPAT